MDYEDSNSTISDQLHNLKTQNLNTVKLDSDGDSNHFLFFKEIDFEDFLGLRINFENVQFRLKFSTQIKRSNTETSLTSLICNKTLYTNVNLPNTEIASVLAGAFKKDLRIDLYFSVACPVVEKRISGMFKSAKLLSIILLSIFKNSLISLVISFFYYKHILDTPNMIRRNSSPKLQHLVSMFQSFGCDDGFRISTDQESFESFVTLSGWLVSGDKDIDYDYNAAYTSIFSQKNS